MKKVIICGHGGWKPADGYTKVPKGCSLAFYTEFSKCLSGDDADSIAAGTYVGQPTRVIAQYNMAPNMRFYPLTQSEKQVIIAAKPADRELLFTSDNGGRPLEHLLKTLSPTAEIEFHWACCSYTQLKVTPGSAAKGINLTQMKAGYFDYDYTNMVYNKIF